LQNEFNQAIELNQALNFDKMNLAPSAALTDSLFKKAGFNSGSGFSAPIEPNTVTWTAKFLSHVSNLINRYATGAAATLVSASIIFSIYNTVSSRMHNSATNIDNEKTKTTFTDVNANNRTNILNNNYPITSSIENKIQAKQNAKSTNKLFNNDDSKDFISALRASKSNNTSNKVINTVNGKINSKDDNSIHSDNLSDNNMQMPNNSIAIEPLSVEYSKANSDIGNQIQDVKSSGGFSITPLVIDFDYSEKLNISIEMGGVSALNYYPNRSIDGTSAGFNNMNFSVKYNFNDNHSLGLSGGKESLQMYEIAINKKKYIFNKESNLLWAGINYKYSLDKIESLYNIQPYSETTFGGSKYGPVAKQALGLSYNVLPNFNFSLGFEWTSLVYSELSTIKATHKSGIVYKLSYNF